ncbi:MAG: 7-carboxy-7-deazaguanine synthase [Sphingomonadales bacterium]|jgi:7-carboxy-7-deazaguanine synthase (Cx14CxxC type)
MTYSVKELFLTLQGEGANTGRRAVFCRFAGCNLWSGLEKDRAQAQCTFCDTDFIGTDGPGGGKFKTAEDLAKAAKSIWGKDQDSKALIVCTGGEPLLQIDEELINAFHAAGFEIAIETNGTIAVPNGIDWVCVSPKGQSDVIVTKGDELKLVYPQDKVDPARFENWDFTHFFIQPMDNDKQRANTQASIQYCLDHPKWRLSLQTHKIIGIA